MATRHWRPFAIASVVTATLAGAVVLRAVVSDDDESPAFPGDDTTVVASPTSSSPGPAPAIVSFTAAEPVLQKQVFGPGEPVTTRHGIGFLNAENGALETWSAIPAHADPSNYDQILATPDGALLVFWGLEAGAPPWLVERATGRTWRLSKDIHLLTETGHGLLMVITVINGNEEQPAVLNLADGSLKPFGASQHLLSGMFGFISPDARRVVIHAFEDVYLLELATLKRTDVATGVNPDQSSLQVLPGGLGFVVAPHDETKPRAWYSWEGVPVESKLAPGALSPNGKYLARRRVFGTVKTVSGLSSLLLGEVSVQDRATGSAILALRSSDPIRGNPWSITGDSLVVEVKDGYRVVGADGQTISSIDSPGQSHNPLPSPTVAGLLGTNHGTIINLPRNTTIAPRYAQLPWRARWTSRPGELLVELSTPGKGRDWPTEVLPFQARLGPTGDAPPALAVSAPGDCLNLRERPETASSSIVCMADASRASLAAFEESETDPKSAAITRRTFVGVEAPDLTVWLRLSLASGQVGWADSRFLVWAE